MIETPLLVKVMGQPRGLRPLTPIEVQQEENKVRAREWIATRLEYSAKESMWCGSVGLGDGLFASTSELTQNHSYLSHQMNDRDRRTSFVNESAAPNSLPPRYRRWSLARSLTKITPKVSSFITITLSLIMVIVAVAASLLSTTPSKSTVRLWQDLAGAVGVALLIGAFGIVLLSIGDLRFAQTSEQREVGRHRVGQAIARFIICFFFVALLVEIWSQRFKPVINWILHHPLAQFELIFTACVIATLGTIAEGLWYHWWIHKNDLP